MIEGTLQLRSIPGTTPDALVAALAALAWPPRHGDSGTKSSTEMSGAFAAYPLLISLGHPGMAHEHTFSGAFDSRSEQFWHEVGVLALAAGTGEGAAARPLVKVMVLPGEAPGTASSDAAAQGFAPGSVLIPRGVGAGCCFHVPTPEQGLAAPPRERPSVAEAEAGGGGGGGVGGGHDNRGIPEDVVSLFERAEASRMIEPDSAREMRENIRSGRFGPDHYRRLFETRLATLDRQLSAGHLEDDEESGGSGSVDSSSSSSSSSGGLDGNGGAQGRQGRQSLFHAITSTFQSSGAAASSSSSSSSPPPPVSGGRIALWADNSASSEPGFDPNSLLSPTDSRRRRIGDTLRRLADMPSEDAGEAAAAEAAAAEAREVAEAAAAYAAGAAAAAREAESHNRTSGMAAAVEKEEEIVAHDVIVSDDDGVQRLRQYLQRPDGINLEICSSSNSRVERSKDDDTKWADNDPTKWGIQKPANCFSTVQDLLVANKIFTLSFDYEWDSNYGNSICMVFDGRAELEACFHILADGIAASDALIQLTMFSGLGHEESGDNNMRCGLPRDNHEFLCSLRKSILLPAIERNKSLANVVFYVDHYQIGIEDLFSRGRDGWVGSYLGECYFDDLVVPIKRCLDRNKSLQEMNVAVASGSADARGWSPDECFFDLASRLCTTKFGLDPGSFEAAGNRCFCPKCHAERGDKPTYTRAGRSFTIPVGWARIGLAVPAAKLKANDVFNKWHVAFHGTSAGNMKRIEEAGMVLLKPGDVALGGKLLGPEKGHITRCFRRRNDFTGEQEEFDPNQVFSSPSIRYAAHPSYARPFVFTAGGRRLQAKFAFQLRIRPGSYGIGQETVHATRQKLRLDPHIPNEELEYYTKETVAIVIHGLLVHLSPI